MKAIPTMTPEQIAEWERQVKEEARRKQDRPRWTPPPHRPSVTPVIERILEQRYPCEALPHGALTEIGAELGVTHERVRQVAVRKGYQSLPRVKRQRPLCGSCGERPARGTTALCQECNRITFTCDWCGGTFTRPQGTVLNHASDPRYRRGPTFCSKRCPRGPVAFVEQLGREWQPLWTDLTRFGLAVATAGRARGYRIQLETRDDLGRIAGGNPPREQVGVLVRYARRIDQKAKNEAAAHTATP